MEQIVTPHDVDNYMIMLNTEHKNHPDWETLLRSMIYESGWLPDTEERSTFLIQRAPDILMDMIVNGLIDHTVGDGWIITYLTDIQRSDDSEDFLIYLDRMLTNVPRISINNEQDLIKLTDLFVAKGVDAYLYPVSFVYDPIMMMRCGFFPTSENMNNNNSDTYFIDFISGLDFDSINFWSSNSTQFEYDCDVSDVLKSLNTEPRWKYSTLQTYKLHAISTADSMPLLLQAHDYLFTRSKRPITDMSLFRSGVSLKINKELMRESKDIITTININDSIVNTIPVTRYATGMSKGLYHNKEQPSHICGTFFYHEPESTTLLSFNTYKIYKNKYEAIQDLNPLSAVRFSKARGITSKKSVAHDYFNNRLPEDLMMTPNEAFNAYRQDSDIWTEEMVNALPQVKHIAGTYLGLYAFEDRLDQPLCLAGKNHNIDVIILTHMVGRFQVVTEVLDTRSRKVSFASLVYVI